MSFGVSYEGEYKWTDLVPRHYSLHSSTSQAKMWLTSLATALVHWSGVTWLVQYAPPHHKSGEME
jgi:hypothetical protein